MDVHLIPDNYGTRRHPKNKRIRRGTFFSVEELERAIEEYLEENNKQPKRFIWTATAQEILANVHRCKAI